MTTIHVHLTNPAASNLRRCVEHGFTGFWRISESWLDAASWLVIWSEPETNEFNELIAERAPLTHFDTVIWNGEDRRIIHFDAMAAKWLDTPDVRPSRPTFDRMGIAREADLIAA